MAASKADVDRNVAREGTKAGDDTPYVLHLVFNAILVACQFAAMICHIVCFSVLLRKANELDDKLGVYPNKETCVLFIRRYSNGTREFVEYNSGSACAFIIYTSIMLMIMAIIMMIFIILRTIFIKK